MIEFDKTLIFRSVFIFLWVEFLWEIYLSIRQVKSSFLSLVFAGSIQNYQPYTVFADYLANLTFYIAQCFQKNLKATQ